MRVSTVAVRSLVWSGVFTVIGAGQASSPSPRAESGVPPSPPAAGNESLETKMELFHPRRVLVRFRPGATRAAREAVHRAAGAGEVLRDYHVVDGLQLVEVAEDAVPAVLAAYEDYPDVLYAEPDYTICLDAIPDDPGFDLLWGLYNTGQTVNDDPGTPGADIRAPQAWDFWTGDPDFRIAVADTGVNYNHPDLEANIWTNPGEIPGNETDDDGNGYVDDVHGYDFALDYGDPMDLDGHGTHVAGTIAAVANNQEGVVGVNWQAKIVALKIFGIG